MRCSQEGIGVGVVGARGMLDVGELAGRRDGDRIVEDLQAIAPSVVAEGGCAAMLRTPTEWAVHAQGAAVASEPLVAVADGAVDAGETGWAPSPERPLAGLRWLELTPGPAGPGAPRPLAASEGG